MHFTEHYYAPYPQSAPPAHLSHSQPPPPAKARTSKASRQRSCEGCKSRKMRCSRTANCTACSMRGESCVWLNSAPQVPDADANEIGSAQAEIKRLRKLVEILMARLDGPTTLQPAENPPTTVTPSSLANILPPLPAPHSGAGAPAPVVVGGRPLDRRQVEDAEALLSFANSPTSPNSTTPIPVTNPSSSSTPKPDPTPSTSTSTGLPTPTSAEEPHATSLKRWNHPSPSQQHPHQQHQYYSPPPPPPPYAAGGWHYAPPLLYAAHPHPHPHQPPYYAPRPPHPHTLPPLTIPPFPFPPPGHTYSVRPTYPAPVFGSAGLRESRPEARAVHEARYEEAVAYVSARGGEHQQQQHQPHPHGHGHGRKDGRVRGSAAKGVGVDVAGEVVRMMGRMAAAQESGSKAGEGDVEVDSGDLIVAEEDAPAAKEAPSSLPTVQEAEPAEKEQGASKEDKDESGMEVKDSS